MPFVDASGVRLHVQTLGEGAPPVVMLHGLFLGSLAGWLFTTAPRLARRRRVVLYDLRGHGLSGRPERGYDVETMRRDLEAVRCALDLSAPVDLVGHSYGAVIALREALAAPEAVRRLVLVEAPMPPAQVGELSSFLEQSPEGMLEALPEVERAAMRRGGRRARRRLEALSALVTETTLLSDLAAEPDVDDAALGALRVPTRLVYGAHSSCLPAGERLAGAIPGADLVRLDGGHFLPLEAPRALTGAIAEFLDG